MIYQRRNSVVIKGNDFTDYKVDRNILSGFKFHDGNRIIYSTIPVSGHEQAKIDVEWAVSNEPTFALKNIELEYVSLLSKLKAVYEDSLARLILRQKIETLCVNEKMSMLRKYEIKIKVKKNQDEYLICSGGEGSLNDVIKKTDLWNEINNQISFYRLPFCSFKYSGKMKVLLGNQATGFLCHEAIGHMAESDMVEKGSAFNGKLGQVLFDKRISILDSGKTDYGAGNICFDEEGTDTGCTYIVKDGVLNSYLTDKYYARKFGLKNTGNRRSSSWRQPSNIRMTNTFMNSGTDTVENMISSIDLGIYVKNIRSGDCFLDGSFVLRVKEACLIKDGKMEGRLSDVIIDEKVFSVLNSIYSVGDDSRLCLGCSSCGKGGSIKVDAGGPHLLVEANVRVNDRFG